MGDVYKNYLVISSDWCNAMQRLKTDLYFVIQSSAIIVSFASICEFRLCCAGIDK